MARAVASGPVYQFKITLLEIKPPIWRRIQAPDCTLDQLHEQIQAAMGWTNFHLHQFEIGGHRYGDPEMLGDGWDDDVVDSTAIRLSGLLKKQRQSFRFFYEYDFGDGCRHEIVYEGSRPPEDDARYPRCLEGARACPPEDIGGPWSYPEFLETIRNPKHKGHKDMLEWIGGSFDPEEFNATSATKAMRKGAA